MKKIILRIVCLALTFSTFTGCSKKEENTNENSTKDNQTIERSVTVEELGLTYTTPEEWTEYQKTNIYPMTIKSENTFAEIIYGYITTDDMIKLNTGTETSVIDKLNPICEIIVAKSENFENGTLNDLLDEYNSSEKLAEQNSIHAQEGSSDQTAYTYYIAYGNKKALSSLTGDDLTKYNKILATVPSLEASVTTKDFDDTLLPAKENVYAKTITFDTTALEGAEIDSTIFANYDLTMLNFSGTYTYPQSDEFAVLQQVYKTASKMPEKVNIISAIIDTPGEETEAVALKAKNDAGAEFLTIKLDELLANWVTNNLQGVPSTIFVDNNGKIVGDIVEGTKPAETYIEEIDKHLEALKK